MTTRLPHALPAAGDPEREARHRVLAELLAAYLDRELPVETAAQIDAHLVGCAECRRVLAVHAAVRDRLGDEPVRPASTALRDRIGAAVRALPAPLPAAAGDGMPNDSALGAEAAVGTPSRSDAAAASRWWRRAPWAALALATLAIVIAVAFPLLLRTHPGASPAAAAEAPAGAVIAAPRAPLIVEALDDYRRAMAAELPGSARDLSAVRAALPFPVEPLRAPDAHLVSAWSTTLRGEPAAALAYRWGDRVVVHYVVSERLFFRQPEVRRAVAARRVFAAVDGAQGVLAWAEPASGALLVGDASPAELARARGEAVAF